MKERTFNWILFVFFVVGLLVIVLGVGAGAIGAGLPAIEAVEALYMPERAPESLPMPYLPPPTTIQLFTNADGHLMVQDSEGTVININALAANYDIMARESKIAADMLRKLVDDD